MGRCILIILSISVWAGLLPAYAQSDFLIRQANMTIQMPNDSWALTNQTDKPLAGYIFKRSPIIDDHDREIIPAIMVFVEDAASYQQDVIAYSISKRMMFSGRGLEVDEILVQDNPGYPLKYKNGIVILCHYTDENLEHILLMVHIIDKNNKGIQVYLDMTKSLEKEFISEFWTAIKSLSELN